MTGALNRQSFKATSLAEMNALTPGIVRKSSIKLGARIEKDTWTSAEYGLGIEGPIRRIPNVNSKPHPKPSAMPLELGLSGLRLR